MLVCGASFAGLAVARELAGAGARVLVLDRYAIGERQTSACAAPTEWLRALGLEPSIRQTFGELLIHTPHVSVRMNLPWTFSTFDYRELCALLWEQSDADFETATVLGRGRPARARAAPGGEAEEADRICVRTDRGDVEAPLVVDGLGWRRVLAPAGGGYQPPAAPLSRGLEVHPYGGGDELEVWIDRTYVTAGYGWSFPADGEVRVGVGSFDPRRHVKQPTLQLAEDVGRDAVRYQGNWIPHRLRPAAVAGVFFAGDSAGHCLPLTAEGIRTALYFGIACGRELRAVTTGRIDRDEALRRYAAFSAGHRRRFEAMLRVQRLVPRVPPRLLALGLRGMATDRFVEWSFGHYLRIAPPEFAGPVPSLARSAPLSVAA